MTVRGTGVALRPDIKLTSPGWEPLWCPAYELWGDLDPGQWAQVKLAA